MREMADAMKRQADAADRMLQHIQGDRDDRTQGHRARDGIDVILGMNWLSEIRWS
ncbi:uncharacterized protein G2W53_021911 [Senna tora]|uniref:Uncharacterized protein n=1 Tax=Senna tora TaxID=362788 RepID=A0A834TKA4_9FABA|nr:uncharacterized protein G2W53_021911 [Senna tora]